MQALYIYLCDLCGFCREKPGICPYCEIPLAEYNKEDRVSIEEAMHLTSQHRGYF